MMIAKATLVSVVAGIAAPSKSKNQREPSQDKIDSFEKFSLIKWMKLYNPNFDQEKHWSYGCNCHFEGVGF